MPQVTLLYHGVHEQWLFQFTPAFYVSKSTFFRFFFFYYACDSSLFCLHIASKLILSYLGEPKMVTSLS